MTEATSRIAKRLAQHAAEVEALHEQTAIRTFALNGEPQWVPEWKEYAAMTLAGDIVYGDSYALCAERKRSADETWARHNANK